MSAHAKKFYAFDTSSKKKLGNTEDNHANDETRATFDFEGKNGNSVITSQIRRRFTALHGGPQNMSMSENTFSSTKKNDTAKKTRYDNEALVAAYRNSTNSSSLLKVGKEETNDLAKSTGGGKKGTDLKVTNDDDD
jgi:hypothetical protein